MTGDEEAPKLNRESEATFTEPKPARAKVRRAPAQEPEVQPADVTPPPRCCAAGHEVMDSARFCPRCGLEIVDPDAPRRCGNGHDVLAVDRFCSQCGVPVNGVPGSAARTVEIAPFKRDSELSDAERAERARLHDLALRLGRETPVVAYAPGHAPAGVKTVVVHFLVDGFGAFGYVWMRGQEIELWPGHPRWAVAQSWINLDTEGQYRRFGRQVFGLGPWPGEHSYTAGAGRFQPLAALNGEGSVPQPTVEELARADEAERRRGRRVPAPIA